MIPSLPETVSAAHVEYFPLPAAYLTSVLVDACRHRNRILGSEVRYSVPAPGLNSNFNASSEEQPSKKLPTLDHVQLSGAATLSDYFRGHDLCYAPHVHVPAAESVRNCQKPITIIDPASKP